MSNSDLDGKQLYFEMTIHLSEGRGTVFRKGMSKLSVAKREGRSDGPLSIMWMDSSDKGRAITFDQKQVNRFVENRDAEIMKVDGKELKPDYIYKEELPSSPAAT